jgi:hypothetical protein
MPVSAAKHRSRMTAGDSLRRILVKALSRKALPLASNAWQHRQILFGMECALQGTAVLVVPVGVWSS